jgi:hypothetical protein
MVQETIPIVELEKTDVALSELLARYQGQTVGFHFPQREGMLLLLPSEDYRFVPSVVQARHTLPTRLSKTPAEHFADIVHILRSLEKKYGMSSAEFYDKFQQGLIQEGPDDYWEWRTRYKSFLAMRERFGF